MGEKNSFIFIEDVLHGEDCESRKKLNVRNKQYIWKTVCWSDSVRRFDFLISQMPVLPQKSKTNWSINNQSELKFQPVFDIINAALEKAAFLSYVVSGS